MEAAPRAAPARPKTVRKSHCVEKETAVRRLLSPATNCCGASREVTAADGPVETTSRKKKGQPLLRYRHALQIPALEELLVSVPILEKGANTLEKRGPARPKGDGGDDSGSLSSTKRPFWTDPKNCRVLREVMRRLKREAEGRPEGEKALGVSLSSASKADEVSLQKATQTAASEFLLKSLLASAGSCRRHGITLEQLERAKRPRRNAGKYISL